MSLMVKLVMMVLMIELSFLIMMMVNRMMMKLLFMLVVIVCIGVVSIFDRLVSAMLKLKIGVI